MRIQTYSTIIFSVIAITLLGGILKLQNARLNQVKDIAMISSYEQLEQKDDTEVLRLTTLSKSPGFGFRNLIADWTFLSFLQYFGDDEAREKVGYQISPEFFRVVLDRDPYFFLGYVFLSGSTSMYAAQPQTTVDIIEQHLPVLTPEIPPESAIIWRYKGVDELLFLGKFEAAQQSYETAAEWAEQSPDPAVQATAAASRQTAEFIAENPDSRRTLIAGWSQILSQAIDENTFNLAVQQVEALGGSVVRTENGGISVQIPENLDEQNP
jgi:hypothetical protein